MSKTPDYFSGKTIVITGAGSGIGRAAALIFAREGANVVCADINEAGVEQTVEQVDSKFGNSRGQALALTIDVTEHRAAVDDMVQLAIGDFDTATYIAEVSKYCTIEPGDVMWMGTDGVPDNIKPGDTVEIEISGIGVLRNRVVAGT